MALLQIHEPGQSPAPDVVSHAIGIDLGTTNSVVAIVKDGHPVALDDDASHSIVPSALFANNNEIHAGNDALNAAAAQSKQSITSFKRLMGRHADEAASLLPEIASLLNKDHNETVAHYTIGSLRMNAVDMSASMLKHMRKIAQQALDDNVTRAVITVPAYFDDAARQATKQAAMLAGLDVLRLINEPTAAALAYGLEHNSEGVYAIYDLGGGTFDISILRLEQGVFQVLSTAGDTTLGGIDIDNMIADQLASSNTIDRSALLSAARSLKEALSDNNDAHYTLHDVDVSLTAESLAVLAKPTIDKTLKITARAIADAELALTDINGVVMVGGSTRLNAVQHAVDTFFDCPIYNDLDPDRVVAYGAAIQAHALTHGSEHLLLDVVPLSLGLEIMGDIVEKVIYRNSPIPAQASQEFTTYQDGQTGMKIHVLQGEREMVDQCRSLAEFELTGIPPLPAGVARIAIQFIVDADGLLTVSAKELHTGIMQTVQVKPSYGLPIDAIESMIRDSMEHGRDDMLTRLMAESIVDATRTINETKSALNSDTHLLSESELANIMSSQSTLQTLINTRENRDMIENAHHDLKEAIMPLADRRMNEAVKKALAGNNITDMNT